MKSVELVAGKGEGSNQIIGFVHVEYAICADLPAQIAHFLLVEQHK